jgi:hypothetical protein
VLAIQRANIKQREISMETTSAMSVPGGPQQKREMFDSTWRFLRKDFKNKFGKMKNQIF